MDSGAAACGGTETSMIKLLNNDALEEVFVHCSPRDLLALRSTCGSTASLLDSSEKVWLAKLRECFGLNLRVRVGCMLPWIGTCTLQSTGQHWLAALPSECLCFSPAPPWRTPGTSRRHRWPVCALGEARL
jgi:hypothetical protein